MSTKSKQIKEQMCTWLLSELAEAEAAGLAFRMDGESYSTWQAQDLIGVMEEGYYMKSYVDDGQGRIVQVDFEHIEHV